MANKFRSKSSEWMHVLIPMLFSGKLDLVRHVERKRKPGKGSFARAVAHSVVFPRARHIVGVQHILAGWTDSGAAV